MEMPDCAAKPALNSRDHDRADYGRGSRGKQDDPEFCEQVLACPICKRCLDTLGEKGAKETVGKPRNQYEDVEERKGHGDAPGSHACYPGRSEEHTSELQSLMRHSYAVFCLNKK